MKHPRLFFIVFFLSLPGKQFAQNSGQTALVISSAEEAVGIGLSNSVHLKYQELNMLINKQLARAPLKTFIPLVSMSFSENDSIKEHYEDTRSKNLSLTLHQNLFDGGKAKLERDTARTNSMYSHYELETARKQYALKIIEQYRQIVIQNQKISIQDKLIKNTELGLAILEKQYQLGLAIESDYLEYKVSLASLKIEYIQMEIQLKNLYHQMNVLLYFPDAVDILITGPAKARKNYISFDGRGKDLALIISNNNKDLEKQKILLGLKRRQLRQSKMIFLPDIAAEASMSFSSKTYPLTQPSFSVKLIFSFNNDFFPASYTAGAGFENKKFNSVQNSVSASLPNNFTYFKEQKINDIAYQIEDLNLSQSKVSFIDSVNETIQNHDYYINQFIVQKEQISLLNQKVSIDKKRLELGEIKNTDLLDTMIELSNAEMSLAEIENNIVNCENALEILIDVPFGGIWNVLDENKS